MKRWATLPLAAVLAFGAAACQLDSPTETAIIEEERVAPPRIASAAMLDLISAIEDVNTRILPTLDNEGEAGRLATHLSSLGTHLLSGRMVQSEQALGLARGVLSGAGAAPLGHPADVGVVQLLLNRAEQVLREELE